MCMFEDQMTLHGHNPYYKQDGDNRSVAIKYFSFSIILSFLYEASG